MPWQSSDEALAFLLYILILEGLNHLFSHVEKNSQVVAKAPRLTHILSTLYVAGLPRNTHNHAYDVLPLLMCGYTFFYLILTKMLIDRYYYPHFTDEEAESQRA